MMLYDPQGKIAKAWMRVSPQTTVPIVLAAIPGDATDAAPSQPATAEPHSGKPITDSVKPPPPGNNTPPGSTPPQ